MSGLRATLCAALFSTILLAASSQQVLFAAPQQVAAGAGTIASDKVTELSTPEEQAAWRRLKAGEVVVQLTEVGQTKFVTARILINDNAQNVWKVLANPFEFEKKITPRMTRIDVLRDEAEHSVMRCSFEICPPIPNITYEVESDYKLFEEVSFHRIGGAFKDFKGNWILKQHENGKATEILYSMYIDTGLPVPQWIVRRAVRMELPKTLIGLRKRIHKNGTGHGAVVSRSIMAVQGLTTAHVNRIQP